MSVNGSDRVPNRIEELEQRLREAEYVLQAIREGEVDAFAINKNDHQEVYTLHSGDYAYRILIEKFNEGAANLSEDGLIVYTNVCFSELIDAPSEKIVGTSVYDWIDEDFRLQFRELFKQALKGSSKGEIMLKTRDKQVPVYVSLTSLQPYLPTVGMIITDFTEKRKHEQLIRNYQRELEDMNTILSNKNRELEQRIFHDFSESFADYKSGGEFFDSLTQDISDKTDLDYVFIGEVIPNGDGEYDVRTFSMCAFGKLSENMQYPLANGPCEKIVKGTVYNYPSDCTQIFPKCETVVNLGIEGYIGYPLCDGNGKPIGLIAVMHREPIADLDYTQSLLKIAAKRTEMELERIRNEKILEAKNMELMHQNSELVSFAYIASHDLQEPLRKIQGFSKRIIDKQDNLSATTKDYLRRINAAAERMRNLIEALLSYSRTNTTAIVYQYSDLNQILDEIRNDLQERIQEKNAIIESENLPTLKIIPFQFQQLLQNLISNSLKYSKADVDSRIKVSASIVDSSEIKTPGIKPESKYWRISVADNGIGFEQEYEHKIFELFQRLHGKTEYSGTGIGLAICKKIVQNHNGYITATGEPEVGATFNIYLPVSQ